MIPHALGSLIRRWPPIPGHIRLTDRHTRPRGRNWASLPTCVAWEGFPPGGDPRLYEFTTAGRGDGGHSTSCAASTAGPGAELETSFEGINAPKARVPRSNDHRVRSGPLGGTSPMTRGPNDRDLMGWVVVALFAAILLVSLFASVAGT